METAARQAWRTALEAWAVPQRLIDRAGSDPYRQDPELWARVRRLEAAGIRDTPTFRRVAGSSAGGSVLDVGAGSGRLAIALAADGHRVTAVERDPDLARSLADEAQRCGVTVTLVVGAWPLVSGNAGIHDVALCCHVVYDVAAVGDFVAALNAAARRAVVMELGPQHPWAPLSKYYAALHGLARPTRPTAEDFAAVVRETTGVTPRLERWMAPASLRFSDLQELLAFYRRRLLVPPERSLECAALLEPDVRPTGDGWLVLGPAQREIVTMWWRR